MQTAALGAFHGHAGAHDLGEAVHIAVLNAQLVGDLLGRMFSEQARRRRCRRRFELAAGSAHLNGRIGDKQADGGSAGQDVGLAVLKHLNLARVARRGGDDGAAHGPAAGMRPQTTREQAVAVGHLDGGIPSPPTVPMPRAKQSPQFVRSAPWRPTTVAWPVVPEEAWTATSAFSRGGEHAEGVVVAHVLLHDEGELAMSSRVWRSSGARPPHRSAAGKRHVLVGVAQRLLHALAAAYAAPRGHRLNLWVESTRVGHLSSSVASFTASSPASGRTFLLGLRARDHTSDGSGTWR